MFGLCVIDLLGDCPWRSITVTMSQQIINDGLQQAYSYRHLHLVCKESGNIETSHQVFHIMT